MKPEVKDDTEKVIDGKAEGAEVTDDDTKPDVETNDALETDDVTDEDTDITDEDLEDAEQISEAEDRVQVILDKFGYDSLEELEADFDGLKELQDTIGARDANKLIKDAEYLAKVKEFWAEQDEAKKRESETSEETIERLEREKKEAEQKIKDRDKADAKKREEKEQALQAQKMLKSFGVTVNEVIDKTQDLTKADKAFLKIHLGVDNPMNEINIGVRPEVRKTAKSLIKGVVDYKMAVIKDYLAGKIKMPKITPAPETPVTTEKKYKNLEEAREGLKEHFGVK